MQKVKFLTCLKTIIEVVGGGDYRYKLDKWWKRRGYKCFCKPDKWWKGEINVFTWTTPLTPSSHSWSLYSREKYKKKFGSSFLAKGVFLFFFLSFYGLSSNFCSCKHQKIAQVVSQQIYISTMFYTSSGLNPPNHLLSPHIARIQIVI